MHKTKYLFNKSSLCLLLFLLSFLRPLSIVRDNYWEEKWRVLHKKDQSQSEGKSQSTPKGWSEKVKSRLLRTESDPSSSKVYSEKTAPGLSRRHVRKSLLDDLSRQLGFEDDNENDNLGGSEENSSIFSDPPSPIADVNDNDHDHENDTEQSSVGSVLFVDENKTEPDPDADPEPEPKLETELEPETELAPESCTNEINP